MTPAQLARFCPAASKYHDALLVTFDRFHISTPLRRAHFLAQVAHESGGFKAVVENLNYSAGGLRTVFPKYFPTMELAEQYARKPEAIASRVYANRMGNGPEESGEGWRFKGRGLLQVTGKNNYRDVSQALFFDERLLSNPSLLERPLDACLSAGWFVAEHGLTPLMDKDDVRAVTKAVNGGYNGLEHRMELLKAAKDALGVPA